ncbi:Hypothetical predicted protein, partial [Xyrichtys novacula]
DDSECDADNNGSVWRGRFSFISDATYAAVPNPGHAFSEVASLATEMSKQLFLLKRYVSQLPEGGCCDLSVCVDEGPSETNNFVLNPESDCEPIVSAGSPVNQVGGCGGVGGDGCCDLSVHVDEGPSETNNFVLNPESDCESIVSAGSPVNQVGGNGADGGVEESADSSSNSTDDVDGHEHVQFRDVPAFNSFELRQHIDLRDINPDNVDQVPVRVRNSAV